MNFVAEQNSSRVYSFREAEEEIKTDVDKLSAYSSPFRLLKITLIVWVTRQEIRIHSNTRNPLAFQLIYCGTILLQYS